MKKSTLVFNIALMRCMTAMFAFFLVSACAFSPPKIFKSPNAGHPQTHSYPDIDHFEIIDDNRRGGSFSSSKLLKTAYSFLGAPYQFGGNSYHGIDCSGLVYNSFKSVNITMPRSSRDQAKRGHHVSRKKLRKGDLVYFATGSNRSRVSHVGIMINSHSFIHSSTSQGVITTKLSNPYWNKRYLFAKRVKH